MTEQQKILLVEDNKDDVGLITRLMWRYFGPDQKVEHCASLSDAERYI